MKTVPFRLFALGAMLPLLAFGGEGDEMLANYLELKTLEIEDSFLGKSGTDWNERKEGLRLGYMLGFPKHRSRLRSRASSRGMVTVENLHYQSSPGLSSRAISTCPPMNKGEKFQRCSRLRTRSGEKKGESVTATRFITITTVLGFRLTIDTIQLGEIEGIHHGTYSKKRGGSMEWHTRP